MPTPAAVVPMRSAPAPAGRNEYLDQEGNSVVRAWFGMPTEELSVRSAFTLDTLRDNPFNYLLTPADLQLPKQYPPHLSAAPRDHPEIAGVLERHLIAAYRRAAQQSRLARRRSRTGHQT